MNINERISMFRQGMQENDVDAYIIPSSDPHQSEYVAEHWKSRAWISGFTGSAGIAVVSKRHAGLWTDSRYFIQGEKELQDSEFELHKVYNQGSPQFIDWLLENLQEGNTVGCDGSLFSFQQIRLYAGKLARKGIILNATLDLMLSTWTQRPSLPSGQVYELPIKYTGESRLSKINRIRVKMKDEGSDTHLISTLDDIAWIFNIRGSDVTYNPVIIAYSIITANKAILFLDSSKLSDDLKVKLEEDGITILPYDAIWKYLNEMDEQADILIDESTISHKLYQAINSKNKINRRLPSIDMKAIKNEVEIGHFRNVMKKDGVALIKFYRWLEDNIGSGITEHDCVLKLAECRASQDGYKSESFGAIVGYKGNGAIVHYSPSDEGSAEISNDGILLVDSGGQYIDGTTDITRTISLVNITEEEKNAYTRVLKGNIALDKAIYPTGTLGVQLDTLARVYLWEDQLNFLHGTGHGIGFFLNVHEGPQGFHPGVASRSKNAILEGMVTTNEPGYYEAGKFGIRIENCLLTIKEGDSSSGEFLKFETLTLFPIDTSLINFDLISDSEIKWLNDYHGKVLERLSPYLEADEKEWLEKKCVKV